MNILGGASGGGGIKAIHKGYGETAGAASTFAIPVTVDDPAKCQVTIKFGLHDSYSCSRGLEWLAFTLTATELTLQGLSDGKMPVTYDVYAQTNGSTVNRRKFSYEIIEYA